MQVWGDMACEVWMKCGYAGGPWMDGQVEWECARRKGDKQTIDTKDW